MHDTLVPPPVWPLPIDTARALKTPEDNSTWNVRCPSCLSYLKCPPNDPGALKRHEGSARCVEATEVKEMYDRGYHVLKSGTRTLALMDLVVAKKMRLYYPSTVASYHRWLNRYYSKTDIREKLDAFLKMSLEEQEAHILGLNLQYELALETEANANAGNYNYFPF